jgi:hypothetical protein
MRIQVNAVEAFGLGYIIRTAGSRSQQTKNENNRDATFHKNLFCVIKTCQLIDLAGSNMSNLHDDCNTPPQESAMVTYNLPKTYQG